MPGPAILADSTQTIVVEPGCIARLLPQHVTIDVDQEQMTVAAQPDRFTMDPITLAVFAARFMR